MPKDKKQKESIAKTTLKYWRNKVKGKLGLNSKQINDRAKALKEAYDNKQSTLKKAKFE